jgi:hypothetical protein
MVRVRCNGRFGKVAAGAQRLAPALALSVLAVGPAVARDLPALLEPWSSDPPQQAVAEAAPPFHLAADAQTRARAETCLASAIYYEAGNQTRDGQEAVAQVVLNRVRHPNYPKSVCGVVYQGAEARGCQFTFACDGSLRRAPDARGWREAEAVAERALDGFVAASVGASTHYHTLWVHPAWGATMTPTRRIGAHQFYRLAGGVAELTGVYAGLEPAVAPMAITLRRLVTAPPTTLGVAASRPRAAPFTAWGLQIAIVTPGRGGDLLVSESGAPTTAPPAVSERPASAVAITTGS